MNLRQALLLLLGLSHATGDLLCQTLPFHGYTTRDGLPSNHITALCQDSQGYLWIGTDNGLSVYDGIEFKNFTTSDGLPNLYITEIIESRKRPGSFWIGTIAGGLARMVGGHFATTHVGDNNVSSLSEDPEGGLWCSSGDGNHRIANDSDSFVSNTDPNGSVIQGLSSNRVAVFTAHKGTLYRPNGSVILCKELALHEKEFVDAATLDATGMLWAFTSEGRLLGMNDSLILSHIQNTSLIPSWDIPTRLMDDGRGSLWITTAQGILIVNKRDLSFRTLRNFDSRVLKPSGPILSDREGTVWFGTYAHGLVKLLDDRIFRIPLDPVSEATYNLVACSDTNGHIWISTTSALTEVARSEAKQWKVFRHPIGPWTTGYASSALMIDPQDRLWIVPIMRARKPFLCYGIRERTDAMSEMEPLQSILPEELATDGVGLTFAIDQYHRGWFTFGPSGVALVDLRENKLVRTFTQSDGLPFDSPRALLVDRTARLWYGTWATGLFVIEQHGDTFSVRKEPRVAEGAGVRSLYEDRGATIWIGTRYGGLVRYRDGKYVSTSVSDGLLSNSIWSLAETDHRIWCGTDVGLEVVDKQTGKPLPPKTELVGNRVYACGSYKNEYVWCVLANELVVYEQPERIATITPPPVFIKSFSVNGIPVPPDSSHEFDHTQNSCTFDFVGISFRDERNVRYQYRMLGHDSLWTRPGREHSVTFASLRPGIYEFEVRAINGDGTASIRPASISFVIVPPVWFRWWFILGIALLGLSIVYGLFRYRLYHLMKLERLRLRIASDLHDDVGTNLSSIVVASQIMEREGSLPDELRTQLKEIGAVAAASQEMMRDIVWMLNPSHDSLDDFLLKMKDVATRLLSGVTWTFEAPRERLLEKVSVEFKRNVFLIFKESLNNIVRHSEATQVIIEVSHGRGTFTMRIRDNGRGFDAQAVGPGSGIANLRRRAAQIGGELEVVSDPAQGTVVSLSVQNHANA